PPAVTPPPPPPPPAEPSQNFSLNSYVAVKGLSNVRATPGGTFLGEQNEGAIGEVVGGPVLAKVKGAGYWFWNINFENDPDGWVAESTLKSVPKPELAEDKAKPAENAEAQVAGAATESEPAIEAVKTAPPEQAPIETTAQTQVAQATGTPGANSLASAVVIGLAILIGLIAGSWVISRAIYRNRI
ncbi:MAG: hypothetical protein AAB930_01990, partial [Patescibacteria group bacterium]